MATPYKITLNQKKSEIRLKNSLKVNPKELNKKGITPLGIVVILVLIIVVLFISPFSFGITTYFLSKNVFVVLGVFLAVVGAIGVIWMPVPKQIALTLVLIGIGLILIPEILKILT